MPQKKRRDALPTRQAITDHWFPDRMDELGVFNYSQDELPEGCCWACGRPGKVERCHIKSHQHGGADTVDNLALLCPGCHDESEDLPDTSFFTWIRAKRRDVWQDEFTHARLKLERLGFSYEVVHEMVAAIGCEATIDKIATASCADATTAARMADRMKSTLT